MLIFLPSIFSLGCLVRLQVSLGHNLFTNILTWRAFNFTILILIYPGIEVSQLFSKFLASVSIYVVLIQWIIFIFKHPAYQLASRSRCGHRSVPTSLTRNFCFIVALYSRCLLTIFTSSMVCSHIHIPLKVFVRSRGAVYLITNLIFHLSCNVLSFAVVKYLLTEGYSALKAFCLQSLLCWPVLSLTFHIPQSHADFGSWMWQSTVSAQQLKFHYYELFSSKYIKFIRIV